jgi:PelA/Pel-15E family pectate lyase
MGRLTLAVLSCAALVLTLAACSASPTTRPVHAATPPAETDTPSPEVPARVVSAPRYEVVSLSGFQDGIRHFERWNGDYARYEAHQIVEIAENILLAQRDHGGWVENQDPTRVLSHADEERLKQEKSDSRASFDNRNIYTQIEYLFSVFEQTKEPRFAVAALQGLEYTLRAQSTKCGGFPHTLPGTEPYHRHVTFADDVTPGVLGMLRRMEEGAPPYASLDQERRTRARAARERGDACLLKLQVVQSGKLTGWAGQYDADTLKPAQGRAFELPALVSSESVKVVRYLMAIPNPSAQVRESITAAMSWFERSKLTGQRLEEFALAEPAKFEFHTAATDRRLVHDPAAPPLWARFYDLVDNGVVLANRDGRRVREYADIHLERRTGYSWYGTWPAKLIDREYAEWQAKTRTSE